MTKYLVLSADNDANLCRLVETALANGWSLAGGVAFGYGRLLQAVTR